MKGGNMLGIYILFGAAVVMLVAAVFIYSNREENSFDKLLSAVNEAKAETKSATTKLTDATSKVDELKQLVDDRTGILALELENLKKQFEKVKTENEILVVRQHSLEKKIIAKDRNVNLTVNPGSAPIAVEILQKPPPVPTKKPLLEKAGIKKKQEGTHL
jgi:mannitol-specific phosphotransferase system IIBC component